MVRETALESLKDIKLDFKARKYPIPNNSFLPRMFFVGMWIGSRASGKTYSVVQLLKQYEHHGIYTHDGLKLPQRIILFSPTVSANPVFESLKYLHQDDIYTKYSDHKLIKEIKDIQSLKLEIDEYKTKIKAYNRLLKNQKLTQEEFFGIYPKYDLRELNELEMSGYEKPEPPMRGDTKYTEHPVYFFILDDLVGTDAFKTQGKSALTNLVLKNRHLSINLCILTQNLKAIPKSIRNNTSLFVIFKFASKKPIEDLYEEVASVMTEKEFHDLLDHATSEEHSSLVIDFTNDKTQRFKKNFNKILLI